MWPSVTRSEGYRSIRGAIAATVAPLLLLLVGCADPPTEKVEAAELAVNEALSAGATFYLAEDFAKLEDLLARAQEELAVQDSKLGFLRDYTTAEQLLAEIQEEADRITAESERMKEAGKPGRGQESADADESERDSLSNEPDQACIREHRTKQIMCGELLR